MGISFLPESTIERASKGSPVEKVKLQKDGTPAFVDVYEYAKKIREGKITWDEVEKADLESVRRLWCSRGPKVQLTHIVCSHTYFLVLQRLKWVGMLHRAKRTPSQATPHWTAAIGLQ